MSQEFLNDPKYQIEGIESFKGSIEDFFTSIKPKDRPKAQVIDEKPKVPKLKVKLPDVEEQTEEQITYAVEMALKEMDHVRSDFLDFQKRIQDLALYPYIFPDIERFVESCKDMMDMLGDNINIEDLTPEGRRDYEELQKVRARILSSIYNHYKKEE
jgi:hypothetical protein